MFIQFSRQFVVVYGPGKNNFLHFSGLGKTSPSGCVRGFQISLLRDQAHRANAKETDYERKRNNARPRLKARCILSEQEGSIKKIYERSRPEPGVHREGEGERLQVQGREQ